MSAPSEHQTAEHDSAESRPAESRPRPDAVRLPVQPDAARSRVSGALLDFPRIVVNTPPVRRGLLHSPSRMLLAQIVALTTLGAVVGLAAGISPAIIALTVVVTLVSKFHSGRAALRPGMPHLRRIATDTTLPLAGVALGVAAGAWDRPEVQHALVLVVALNVADLLMILARRRFVSPMRVVIVGAREEIASYAERWADNGHVDVVGGLIPGVRDDDRIGDTHRVRTIGGVSEISTWVERWAADLVLVTTSARLGAEDVRELSWLLEDGDAGLALTGVLDSVAPHRLDATQLGGATLVHARASKPSAYIRAVKWLIDRMVGTALLLGFLPLLVTLCVLIRLDSRGNPVFRQTRVGKDGRPFTIYKLRTMRVGADDEAQVLEADNDGNGVLFKRHEDPRVTRVGRFLRRTSLDELPQLLNVVLGQMSLAGPRPNLPREVAEYDEIARRRLAVRPGMTGLWQVSGRSDLSWDETVALDVRYVDNYRISDDLAIGLRTVEAVVRPSGAY